MDPKPNSRTDIRTRHMTLDEIECAIERFPRRRIGFYPTPLHKAENISRKYGVDIYFKREDMAGPGTISGSKVRPAEFIIGEALEQGVTHILTVGAYLSNSATQLASAAIQAGITPIVFLYDNLGEGYPAAWRGNLLLNKVMGIEVHCFPRKPDESQEKVWDQTLYPAVEVRKAQLEAEGNKVLVAAAGAIHPSGLAAHLLTYKEISEQSHALGFTPDYLYHTTGTGGVLPAFVAGNLLTGGASRVRSIAISSYRPDNYIHHGIIVDRVKAIYGSLRQIPPTEGDIMAEIDIDQRFIGEDYAVPSTEGTAAIRELAMSEAIFLGPVYTAKGFAGLLTHIREGKVPAGSKVVFLHTGDTSNLFEDPRITGAIAG
ncbi:1-aminocyclopropane-1-carboxylate deaminase/D-cysteine desulfhydrase [Microvirga sp. VF16]|uniref:1-aminocyclopropane-1-carboxylate deaminase/D-cysteine desulfhydrase n=1 Tax=Microvirga sp. VF16 TaxID=2807101 RepID=UPI00193D0414|nr:pyridoxal-phosphate dependent enzyme [Microvirga sp. VF16]QRM32930.1 pyridoxal-phosphate dependent enzyme [Microvirga sp. VF16]